MRQIFELTPAMAAFIGDRDASFPGVTSGVLIPRVWAPAHLRSSLLSCSSMQVRLPLTSARTIDDVPQVIPGSPAEKGGLREGDVIVEIDGKEVVTARQLIEAMGKDVGRALTVRVLRSGSKDAVECRVVTEDERQGSAAAAQAAAGTSQGPRVLWGRRGTAPQRPPAAG